MPTAPTAPQNDNTSRVATTSFVASAISDYEFPLALFTHIAPSKPELIDLDEFGFWDSELEMWMNVAWADIKAGLLTSPVLNGIASGTAITETIVDATAGRLLKVGSFGIGAALGQLVIDCNTLPDVTGLWPYLASSTSTNKPPANFYFIEQIAYAGGNKTQIAWPYQAAVSAPYIRSRYGGVWTSWKAFVLDSDLTVTETPLTLQNSFTNYSGYTTRCRKCLKIVQVNTILANTGLRTAGTLLFTLPADCCPTQTQRVPVFTSTANEVVMLQITTTGACTLTGPWPAATLTIINFTLIAA